MKVTININGKDYSADVEPRMTLVDFIRDVAGLKGTHVGCETGHCGACSVLIDGRPVKSCLMLAVQANGKRITTIEGIGKDGGPNEVQMALSSSKALQCAFCSTGFVVVGTWALEENGELTEDVIKESFIGNVCRCTGYEPIIKALRGVRKND